MNFNYFQGGWNILNRYAEEAPSSNHQWSLLENLPIVQVKFGVHPFFKVSIEDGNITLSEGELGLPNEQLYYYHRDHPVIDFHFKVSVLIVNFHLDYCCI